MKTVTLVHTEFGIEVRCPDCDEKLDRVPTEAAAFNRTGEYLKHPCLAAVIRGEWFYPEVWSFL